MSTIRWVLREIDDYEKSQANLQSISVARLATTMVSIAHGFSGAKGPAPNVQPKDFLPFPEWKPSDTPEDGPNPETREVLMRLFKRAQIPHYVFTALLNPVKTND